MNEKWLRLQFPYFHPESGSGGTGGSDNRGTEGDADILAEGEDSEESDTDDVEDDDKDDKDDKKRDKKAKPDRERKESDSKDDIGEFDEESDDNESEDNSEDEDGEEETDEDEEKEEDDEIEEDKEVENEFTVRALKKSYPDIFKKFPEVKDAIFRERMFTKLFGSVDEAEDASNKAQYLDTISQELFEGKSENLLKSLKKNSEESLRVFASGFLPQLFKTDKDLYHEITDHTLNHVLHVVNNNALKNGNKNLATAVKYISQFLFGEQELPELKQLTKPKERSEAEIALDRRRKNTKLRNTLNSRNQFILRHVACSKRLLKRVSKTIRV